MKKELSILMFLISAISLATPITKIEIQNNKKVPSEVILSSIEMKEGTEYNQETMLSDYSRLQKLKYFNDVELTPIEDKNGVTIKISVSEKDNVVDSLKEDGIINLVDTNTYINTENTILNVKVLGNSFVSAKDIIEMSGLNVGSTIDARKIEEARMKLLEKGIFQNVMIEENKNDKKTELTIKVLEGPIVNNVKVDGSSVYSSEQLATLFSIKSATPLNVNDLKAGGEALKELYAKDGYVLAGITDATVDNNGTLKIKVAEGIVRKIEAKKMIVKQKGVRRNPSDDVLKTKDYVIDREVALRPGKIFNIKDFELTANNLMRLGIFRNIKFETRAVSDNPNLVDIILLIDEDRTTILNGGVSYGTESGFMGTISIKDTNWAGKNQTVEGSLEKSTKSHMNINISFLDPWIKDTDRVSWGWGAYRNVYGTASPIFNKTKVIGGRINIGKGLNATTSINLGTKLEYIKESPLEGNDGITSYTNNDKTEGKYKTSTYAHGLNDKYVLFSLHPYVVYDTRNSLINATSGIYGRVQVEGGYASGYKAGIFGSANADLRYYHKGFFEKNSFAFRAQAGLMTASTKEPQKYWVGGGSSLRGVDNGFFKGNKKLTLTAENRTTINDYFGVVFFVDAGRAWDYSLPGHPNGRDIPTYAKNDTSKYGQFALGAGAGIRFNSPIGPLRFDVAWPLYGKVYNEQSANADKIEDIKREMKFYFNVGHSF